MVSAGPITSFAEELSFAQRLASLDAQRLAHLLSVRPEVLWQPLPRNLGELAERLERPHSVAAVLQSAPLPCLQLAEAIQALGGVTSRHELAGFLDNGDDARLDRVLDWLAARALVWTSDELIKASAGLGACLPDPLGLGRPLGALLTTQSADTVQRMLRELGQPRPKARAATVAALTAYLRKPETVRAIVAGAPVAVAGWLTRRAAEHHDDVFVTPARYDPAAYRAEQDAVHWAQARGMLLAEPWGYGREMPAEVTRALRGPGYRAPFTPQAPEVATREVTPEQVDRGGAAAATAFSAQATAVLDHVRRVGIPTLKSGGVGAREVTRLAKATQSPDIDVRLVLELAGACGLLAPDGLRVEVGAAFPAWREDEPAQRFGDLVAAWWQFGAIPTETRAEGKALPVLHQEGACAGCVGARHALFAALSTVPVGRATGVAEIGPAALWARPLVHGTSDAEDVAFSATWREAELLGLVSHGSLSHLGRLLVPGDHDALAALAATVLPGTVDHAVFGTDLTAVVGGTPSARVTALLDGCADRESRGAGVVWRITAASVRRALDDGISGHDLRQQLTDVAGRDLPQPLRYLITDVARRHGSVRVHPVVSCVRSDDVALLAEAAADRGLRQLRLSVLAPTVLTSEKPVDDTVTALRAAGYLPMPEGADGAVVAIKSRRPSSGAARLRTARNTSAARPVDVPGLAARLVAAGSAGPPASGP